jgi:DNA replication and repair protein RecF
LSLKVIEADSIEASREQKPLLLLDDVFSELDETRQTKLVEYFKKNQVIITTTTITPLIQGISGKIFEL